MTRILKVYGGPTGNIKSSNNELTRQGRLTFNLFFDGFGRIQPVTDVVVVGVLEAEVILLDDVHLVVDLLQQLLSGGLFLER